MNILLKAEIEWINKNQHLYTSPLHARAVIGNITKRYEIVDLKKQITVFKQRLQTKELS